MEMTTQTSWTQGRRWERQAPGRPLSSAGERVLLALIGLCPKPADESSTHAIAAAIGAKPGAAKLALRGLSRRRLADAYEDDAVWTPTIAGRWRAAEVG